LTVPQIAVVGGRGGGGGGGGRGGGGGAGRVAPGVYKVTMTANGKTYSNTITVRPDPMGRGGNIPPGTLLAIDAAEMDADALTQSSKPMNWPVVKK
jgi:hypothetical protein